MRPNGAEDADHAEDLGLDAEADLSALVTFGAQLLLSIAHGLECPAPPPAPPSYYNLSSSALLRKLSDAASNLTDAQLDAKVALGLELTQPQAALTCLPLSPA